MKTKKSRGDLGVQSSKMIGKKSQSNSPESKTKTKNPQKDDVVAQ